MNYKSFNNLSEDIKSNLYKIHSGNYDLVVGIPRSGMFPAYLIGLYLNVHVTDFDGYINNRPLSTGQTRQPRTKLETAQDANRVLIVDDSITSGLSLANTMNQLPRHLVCNVTTCAIYSDKQNRNDVDLILQIVRHPRVFEWNIFHRDLLANACVDIDGVLCVDPSAEENDDGAKYKNFLINAAPYMIPTHRINSIVTNRLEKYRPQTEAWLNKYGIEYDNLIMLDLPDKETRQKIGAYARHKAIYFEKQKQLDIFIESERSQAEGIMQATGKPVYCVDDNLMLFPGSGAMAIKAPRSFMRVLRYRMASMMPMSLKKFLKKFVFSRVSRQG